MTSDERISEFERRQWMISAIVLLLLVLSAVFANSLHKAAVAEQSTKFISRMIQREEFREIGLIMEQAHLDGFARIEYRSKQQERSFTLPANSELVQPSLWKSILTETVTVPVENSLQSGTPDEILFSFNRFAFVPSAFVLWLILNIVSIPQTRFLKRRLIEQFKKDLETERLIAKNELADEVRHNLQSPLVSLSRLPLQLVDLSSSSSKIIAATVTQIEDLLAKLDDKKKIPLSEKYSNEIFDTLLKARSEFSQRETNNIKLKFDIEDLIVSAEVPHIPFELRAVLGNIINNSINSLSDAGRVLIKASDEGSHISITVTDNGCGIDSFHLNSVFDKDFTTRKTEGTGFGLYHAKKTIEDFGGTVSISSMLGVGTTLTILLPIRERSNWYLPRIKFHARSKIFVLDDVESMRLLWSERLAESGLEEQSFIAATYAEIQRVPTITEVNKDLIYLFDYDLGTSESGLDLLRKLPAEAIRCLVTGHFDDPSVRSMCLQEKIFLIPKSQIAEIPFVVV